MNIVLFTHPSFLGSQSMPRFANMLLEGMKNKGHRMEVLSPEPSFFRRAPAPKLKKWLGYLDQYLVFPSRVRPFIERCPNDTLFVFSDHALGPWVPMVKDRPHVIHCHDFLAQRSALGEIPANPTSFTGRKYQQFIRRGFCKGRNFISVSEKTREDLHRFLGYRPSVSEVVYNGLNQTFVRRNVADSRNLLEKRTGIELRQGYLLHVGGNQWYKNRAGVVRIYDAWRSISKSSLPLLLIGKEPSANLLREYAEAAYRKDIYFLADIEDLYLPVAYSGATAFLFPSLAEGFGWPIAEAMAAGTVVITTGEAPMTEVASDAAFLISRRPDDIKLLKSWALDSAKVVEEVVTLPPDKREKFVEAGLVNASRFDARVALDKIEHIYRKVLYPALVH